MNFKILLISLVILASGCVSESTDSIEEVSSNSESYLGEEVVLQGEVRSEDTDYVIHGREKVVSIVGEEVADVWTKKKVLGNVNGQIDFAGCKVSEFASEVKVKGEIISYERCDCEPQNVSQFVEQEKVPMSEKNVKERASKRTFRKVCESEKKITETLNYNTDPYNRSKQRDNPNFLTEPKLYGPPSPKHKELEQQGCIPDTSKKYYYFSCQEILEEYQ